MITFPLLLMTRHHLPDPARGGQEVSVSGPAPQFSRAQPHPPSVKVTGGLSSDR